jgi:hypothetical protein
MNCCDFNPIVKQSDEGLKYTNQLRFYLYFYIFFSLLRAFTIPNGEFLFEVLIFFFIYLMTSQLSFYYGMFITFFLLFQVFFETLYLLTYLQSIFFGFLNFNLFVLFIQGGMIIIYIMLIKWTFICYREYKALFYEQGGNSMGMGYTQMRDEEQGNNYIMENRNEEEKKFVPFSGKGVTWG